ncbi:hypothetical protein AB0M43_30770 [Longispora sp. NPDC051575]|uniref:hypothetical protein n=1 Tax=Longispora sp. NPDC051575 TaxID=3154943 RepID=UPI00342CB360
MSGDPIKDIDAAVSGGMDEAVSTLRGWQRAIADALVELDGIKGQTGQMRSEILHAPVTRAYTALTEFMAATDWVERRLNRS